MYLRFVTATQDVDSRKKQGLFHSANRLKDEGELDRYELEVVERIFGWFNDNVNVPWLLKEPGYNRCLSWFKPEAKQALDLMWEMYYLLQSKGVSVEVLKENDVGEIKYEDEVQVVAQPFRHNRKIKK